MAFSIIHTYVTQGALITDAIICYLLFTCKNKHLSIKNQSGIFI